MAHSNTVSAKRALVLAGGGWAGIAWETGVLTGVADEAPEAARALLGVEVLVGTSAGSTVAAQVTSVTTIVISPAMPNVSGPRRNRYLLTMVSLGRVCPGAVRYPSPAWRVVEQRRKAHSSRTSH